MRGALALMLAATLSACGLQPMYAGGGSGAVAQGLSQIVVPAIPGRQGWFVRNALQERLGVAGEGSAQYRLDVRLDDDLEALGVLNDDTISRERRVLRARYQLVEVASGDILLDDSVGSDAGVDVVSSEYATIAAEQTALENLAKMIADDIVTEISLTLRSMQ